MQWLGQCFAIAIHQVQSSKYTETRSDRAPQDDFWSNVGRYGSYFFSVLLGTAYTAVKPIGGLLRKPATAAATLAALAALLLFVTSTVSAMLGLGGGSELEVCARRQP